MRAAVVGLGNVGTTIAHVLGAYREILGLRFLRVIKSFPTPWTTPDIGFLADDCDEVVVAEDAEARWQAIEDVDVVFDCRKEGAALADRPRYQSLRHLRAVIAQGSEHGFGAPWVAGVHSADVSGDSPAAGPRLTQVMSCNTHATVALLQAAAGPSLHDLVRADFVVARRSEDLGARQRLVGASVVARHRTPAVGTHHAEDARRVFGAVGLSPRITSSDVTTPSQLLHAVRFSMTLASAFSESDVAARLSEFPYLAVTHKFDSNRVFELGRRYGFQGRLFAHAIVVRNNLLVDGDTVCGWAFVPQEGNTVLSTLAAYLPHAVGKESHAVLQALRDELLLRSL